MVSSNKSTMFLFLLVLPFNIFLPSYTYFILLGIFTVLLLLKCLPHREILIASAILTSSLALMCIFPNVYVLFVTNVLSLLLLFQQLLPSYTFYKLIEIISFMLILRYLLQTYMLLTVSIVGIYALLRYDINLRKTVRCYFVYSLMVIFAFSVGLIWLPISLLRPWNIRNILSAIHISRPLARIIGIEYEIRNRGNMLPDYESAVIVSNHQTAIDILGISYVISAMKVRCTSVGRKMIFWLWPFGLTLWLCGVAFISRKPNFQKTHLQMNEAAELIEKQQAKIWIFPEGTRNKYSKFLFPFKKGAFRMAIKNQIPIIPVVFSPYYFVDWKEKYFEPGKIIVDILPSIKTAGLTFNDIDSLVERTYSIMSKKNDQLRKEMELHTIIQS